MSWAVQLIISAAFDSGTLKLSALNSARIKIEVLKRMFRITRELNIIPAHKYLELESDLQEISKMANGWIKYLNTAR